MDRKLLSRLRFGLQFSEMRNFKTWERGTTSNQDFFPMHSRLSYRPKMRPTSFVLIVSRSHRLRT